MSALHAVDRVALKETNVFDQIYSYLYLFFVLLLLLVVVVIVVDIFYIV